MALSKIQRNMIADSAVMPNNLVSTATYSINGLSVTAAVTATTLNATTLNATTVNATTLALTGNASAVHITASGNLVAAAARATTVTATNAIVTNGTIAALSSTNLTATNITVTNQISVSGGGGLKISGLRSSTSTTIAYYNSSTSEISYGALSELIPAPFDQELNTTNVVRFAGVTATSITIGTGILKFNDATTQTTAWTGTVASSQITSVSTSKVSGLSVVGYSGDYNDLSNRPYIPNQSVDTTSSPTFQNLTVVGTMTTLNVTTENVTQENVVTQHFADGTNQTTAWTGTVASSQITSVSTSKVNGLSTVAWTGKYDDLSGKLSNQALFTTSTVTFHTMTIGPFGDLTVDGTINAVQITGTGSSGSRMYIGNHHDVVIEYADLIMQGDIYPDYSNGYTTAKVGDATRPFGSVTAKSAVFTGTTYIGDLYPYRGGVSWATADGNLGDTNRRWNSLYVNKIYTNTATIYFEDVTGITTTTLSVSSGTIAVNQQVLIDQSVAIGASPSFTTATISKLIFSNASEQTTAWTGSVSTSSVTGLSTVGYTNNYNDLNNKPTSWSTSSIVGLSTIGYTGKLSDATGQISTSSVSGLSTVGFTGKYADLTGTPNQSLDTSSSVQFAAITDTGALSVTGFASLNGGATISAATVTNNLSAGATTLQSLSVTTGTILNKGLSVGGQPLNAQGTFTNVFIAQGGSPAMMVGNYNGNNFGSIMLRNYGQNRPSGTASTAGPSGIWLEGSRGTNLTPTAVASGDTIAAIFPGGFDGNNWSSDYHSTNPNSAMYWSASENWTYDSTGVTTATLAGGTLHGYFLHPAWTKVQPGGGSRQRVQASTSWTTSTTSPSILNWNLGSGIDGTTPTLTLLNGTTSTGFGRMNEFHINSSMFIHGVPIYDPAPDNATLTATNFITIVSNRRSGTSGRRNQIQSGDSLGGIAWNGQTSSSSIGQGSQSAVLVGGALETFTSTARGTFVGINTANTGTTTVARRLYLSDQLNSYLSQEHQFTNAGGTTTILDLTTATSTLSSNTITLQDSLARTAATITTSTVTLPSTSALVIGVVKNDAGSLTGISGTGIQTIGSFDSATYKSGKFVVTISDGSNIHSQEVLMICDGTNTAITGYAVVTLGTGVLGTFSSAMSGATAQLKFTPTGATSMTIKVSGQYA